MKTNFPFLALLGAAFTWPPPAAHAQSAPTRTSSPAPAPATAGTKDAVVLDEFKVFDKKPVPFTDANMDIPRGVNDVQAYYIIGADEIENSGKTELDDVLRDSLTQNTIVETNAQIDPSALSNQLGASSSVNLRGLGSAQTLILINGQRTANFANRGATFQPDINGLPLAAVERVEVLPGNASAIYGGTAVGGVVNVILKRNYRGGQVSASYQNTFASDAPIRTLNAIYGFAVGKKIHVTLSGSYSDGKPLRMKDRPFLIDYFNRAVTNGPASFHGTTATFTSGATPNIVLNNAVVNGFANAQTQTLTLKSTGQALGSRLTHIAYGTSAATPVAARDAALLANAGRYNLDFAPSVWRGLESTLTHVPRKEALMARIDYRLTPAVTLFADFAFNRSTTLEARWVPIGNGSYQFAVPGNAPTNPFRENIFVSIPMPLEEATRNDVTNQVAGGVIGAIARLPGEWRLAADINYSKSSQKVDYGLANFANNTTFGGYAPLLWNGTINPFVDTIAHPLGWPRYYGDWTGYNYDTMLDYNVRASGPLFQLPGGRPVVTVGSEIYTERLPQAYVGGTFPAVPPAARNPTNQHSYFIGQRISTYSGHAEVSVPIISGRNEKFLVRGLELQAAVRSEYFEVYTNPDGRVNLFPDAIPPRITRSATESRQDIAKLRATKPTFGLKYQPFRELTVRASYATAFLPPTFAQLTQRINTGGLAAATPTALFFDPVTGTSYQSLSVAGNNPGLGPETSKNWAYGVIWEPDGVLKDFRFNVEYWRIDKMDLIRNVNNVQQLANMGDRAPAGSVTRNATTQQIELFTFAFYNVGNGMTDGWDLSADYRKATPIGVFGFRARTTITDHLKLPPAIGFAPVEYVGYVNSDGVNRAKANGTVSWSSGRHWRASWTTTYQTGYQQRNSAGDPNYLGNPNAALNTLYTAPQGGNSVAAQRYHNVSLGYNFGARHRLHLFRGLTVQVTVNNVFNALPPFDTGRIPTPFFYSRYGNVRLRDYVLRVKKDL
ncbi:MAG: TonB-dependent receptor [Opitutaceae bacterium]|nr:TonB-dependent receptor [Opitutaceae bacterium]